MFVDGGGPILNDGFDDGFAEMFNLYREAIEPEMQGLVKLPNDIQSIP